MTSITGRVMHACMLKMGANYSGQYLSSHKSLNCITLVKRLYKLGVLWKCMFLSQRGIQKIFQLYITPERSTSAFMWYSFKHLFKAYMWRSEDSLQESVLTFHCVSSGNSLQPPGLGMGACTCCSFSVALCDILSHEFLCCRGAEM